MSTSLPAVIAGVVALAGCAAAARVRTLPPLTAKEQAAASTLATHVETLAGGIGPRHVGRSGTLEGAREYIQKELASSGYAVRLQEFDAVGTTVANIETELTGTREPDRIIVVGAHYDTVPGTPGADDNASGVAALLELARLARSQRYGRTVRFVAFVNEEPPWFQTDRMGSVVYARRSTERNERITAMLSLESVGYYSEAPGSQQYPAPFDAFFPDVGDFVAVVSNFHSWGLLRETATALRRGSALPVIASPAPARIPGIGWSDHWAFWQQGYPALVLTGTAPFRNPHYHTATDQPDTIDYSRLARFTAAIDTALTALARAER